MSTLSLDQEIVFASTLTCKHVKESLINSSVAFRRLRAPKVTPCAILTSRKWSQYSAMQRRVRGCELLIDTYRILCVRL